MINYGMIESYLNNNSTIIIVSTYNNITKNIIIYTYIMNKF